MTPLNLLGKPFGRLTVLRKMQKQELGWPLRLEPNSFWFCRCSCGTACVVRGCNLLRGMTRSCGCYKRECVEQMNARRWGHGAREAVATGTRTGHREGQAAP
jgi:hypothetical protein